MIKTDEYGQDVNNEAHSKQKYETYIMNEDKYLERLLHRMNSAFEWKK